jgi:hypothetical protein
MVMIGWLVLVVVTHVGLRSIQSPTNSLSLSLSVCLDPELARVHSVPDCSLVNLYMKRMQCLSDILCFHYQNNYIELSIKY